LSKIITGDETWCFQYDPQKQRTKFAIEKADIPTTQESLHDEIASEDNAHHFL